jgi:hypothetical protein
LQGLLGLDAEDAEGGKDAEEKGGSDGEQDGEREDGEVDGDGAGAGDGELGVSGEAMDGEDGETDAEVPPMSERMATSARADCRRCAVEAPRAERTAASRSRLTNRASWALARLMQAMSRTLRTAARRSQRRAAVRPTRTSFMGWM